MFIKRKVAAISNISEKAIANEIARLEGIEKQHCNLPLVFAQVFKDEINANDEQRLYNGVKRIIKKYENDETAIRIVDEFMRVISGGASLEEILRISGDETLNPSAESDILVGEKCKN